MFSLNILAPLLAIAFGQARLFTEPCIRSQPSGPLIIGGSDGLEECAIVTAPSTVLKFKCGGTLNVIEDIIWYTLIDGDLSLTLVAKDEFYPFVITDEDDDLVRADITVQCGYCLSRQNCSVEFPSYISKPISIDVIDVPRPRLSTPASVIGLTVVFRWLPPLDISGIANYPISYRISVTTSLYDDFDDDIPIQFDFVTSDTQLTVRSCELQDEFVIQPYSWSIVTLVEGIVSDDRTFNRAFQFSRSYPCTDGDIRLVDGVNCNEGRLELCLLGIWGTVCDDGWNEASSKVVCNSLGIPEVAKSHYYGRGTGPIHLDDVICSGTESSILDCQYITDHDCSHNEDIGVHCGLPPQCQDGDIRLIGSPAALLNEGRVEVCNLNVWGTVCDDYFGIADATVACRQLGFPGAMMFYDNAFYGSGIGPILLDDIACTGNEDSLFDCQHSTIHNCVHSEDISVACEPQCTNGDLRLVGGATPLQGWVELCAANVWGRMCDPTWTINEITVLCNELTSRGIPLVSTNSSILPTVVHSIDIQCNGSEDAIVNCNVTQLQFCPMADDGYITMMCHSVVTEPTVMRSMRMPNTASTDHLQSDTSVIVMPNTVSTTDHMHSADSTAESDTSVTLCPVVLLSTTMSRSIAAETNEIASGVFEVSINFVLIAAGALVVFTVLNVCIVLLACFIMRKQRRTAANKSPLITSESQVQLNRQLSLNNHYSMPRNPHEAVNSRQYRTGDDANTYDTIRRKDSFVSERESDDVLEYNELYNTSTANNGHVLNEARDCSVPRISFYSEVVHDVRNANGKGHVDQFDNTTNEDTVNDMEYSSEYNYPASVVIPSLHESDSLHQEMLPPTSQTTVHNDGVATDTTNCVTIPMTHNSAYDVGSARSSPADLKQQLSLAASPMEYTLPIVTVNRQNSKERERENELSYISTDQLLSPVKNPIYQSYSDTAVTDDQLSD